MATTKETSGAGTELRRSEVLSRIAWIQKASIDELRGFWKSLNDNTAVPTPRRTLEQRLIYQVQERAFGGLTAETRTRLEAIADADARQTRARTAAENPLPGTRYIRIWRNERYEVTAVEGGFEWNGQRYGSLSAVAKAITGQHWNGKLFFGVGKHGRKGGGE